MRALENRIPPPVVALLVAAAMWGVARAFPAPSIETSLRFAIAGIFVLSGLIIAALGSLAFGRAQTTVNPLKPEAASSLVVVGVYRSTRNPMYLGIAIALVGWAVYLAAAWVFLGPILFALIITRIQIVPEERALLAKFGPAFTEYRSKVRRWL